MDPLQSWITTIVAVVALLLSAIGLYWQWRDKRRRLVIKIQHAIRGVWIAKQGASQSVDTPVLLFDLVNPSENPIRVKTTTLIVANSIEITLGQNHVFYGQTDKPFTIDSHHDFELFISYMLLLRKLKEQSVEGRNSALLEVKLETGRTFRSKKVKLDMNEMERKSNAVLPEYFLHDSSVTQ
jgi:hypothetical protein